MVCFGNDVVVKFLVTCLIVGFSQCELNISRYSLIESCGLIDELQDDPRTSMPWTVAIFRRTKNNLKYLNSGVLISSSAVLTVFGGDYESLGRSKRSQIPGPENFLIVSGLNSTSLKSVDRFTQFAHVRYILPYSGHDEENKHFHFWLYHLAKPLNMNTPYARAPCLPFFLRGLPSSWDIVHGGFSHSGSLRGGLRLAAEGATALSDEECDCVFRNNYGMNQSSEHVWCTRLKRRNSLAEDHKSCFVHGSVVVTRVLQRWFLTGVAALIPDNRNGACTEYTNYIHAKVHKHADWLVHNIQCGPEQFPCVNSTCIPLSSVCNGVPSCPNDDLTDEDPTLCSAINRCRAGESSCGMHGQCLSPQQICDGHSDCADGSDEDLNVCHPKTPKPILTTTLPTEPPGRRAHSLVKETTPTYEYLNLDIRRGRPQEETRKWKCLPLPISEGMIATCHQPDTNDTFDCSEATENTVATLSCDKFYSPKFRIFSLQMTCTANGMWSPYRRFACEANCGILSTDVTALITHALDANRKNAFPWYAAIFRETHPGNYKYICGASLIEKRVVLTAAHCVEDIARIPYTRSQFKVVLAPVSSNFEDNLDDKLAQVFGVKLVRIPLLYDLKELKSDIAVVELDQPATFSKYVRPVCYLHEFSQVNPNVGHMGKVAGFGYDERGDVSYALKYANLPIVSRHNCQRLIKTELPTTSFCAGYNNGTALCNGDSGGGLVFLQRGLTYEKYYLKGIVSAEASVHVKNKPCNTESYSIFTNVDAYRGWILETLEAIES